ncbi:restriction endonuclease [Ruthenibacterium lactatiformans]|uniref:restriction endonuclease n=1 Tax=Ruthenibacterium lactatiformans TaxID=1550024 RepID=UPI0032664B4E
MRDSLAQLIELLSLPDKVVDISHKGHESMTELAYQAAWARTYLRSYGVIENASRSVWAITSKYAKVDTVDGKVIVAEVVKLNAARRNSDTSDVPAPNSAKDNDTPEDNGVEAPDEVKEWRVRLTDILQNMNPYGFERLIQRVLRSCGFTEVKVTKASGDGGIDGTGKLRINGVFSFNVAFQCKRYKGSVGAPEVRDFRGSLNKGTEKAVLITTGTFTKAARQEAADQSKDQIDLIDGEELIDLIVQNRIGVSEEVTYRIDESFFLNI